MNGELRAMPVSPLTPLSLTAEINLHRLRGALYQLEKSDGFYVDTGGWCSQSYALADAWEEGKGKTIVYWHEQCEEHLHRHLEEPMPIYFGIARENATESEICSAAQRILEVIKQNELPCTWKQGDINSPLLVQLDRHAPYPGDPCDEDEEADSLEVAFYLPKNQDTEEYCWNEREDEWEPENSFHFYQKIKDGETVQDAFLEIDQTIRKHITHYMRCATINSRVVIWEEGFPLEHAHGHNGSGGTLLDGIETAGEEINNTENKIIYIEQSRPFVMTFDLNKYKKLLETGDSIGCQYIFLVKKIGICLYIRSTDHEERDGDDFTDLTLAADGIDEDQLDGRSMNYKQQQSDLYSKANLLYPGELCEWLKLYPEMIDDCDIMVDKGYDKLRIVVDSLTLDLSRFGEDAQINLRSGGILIHNRSIRQGGGPCPLSELECELRLDYMKSKEGSNSAVPCVVSGNQKIHLDRKTLKSYDYND